MNEHSKQRIVEYLQKPEMQERIRQACQQIRKDAHVTISVATSLSGFSENQLRYWEEGRLLNPQRPGGSNKGHRLYSLQELDKLAIIRELQKEGVAPTDIPSNIDQLWQDILAAHKPFHTPSEQHNSTNIQTLQDNAASHSINHRIEDARKDLFWHYFVSHILHVALLLISKDVSRTTLGLVLPLNTNLPPGSIKHIEDLSSLGISLVAVLGKSSSSQILLTTQPAFEYATDFRLLPLAVMTEDQPEEALPADNTLIFLQRRSNRLTLSAQVVGTIRHLLKPIYEDVQRTYACFGPGMRDTLISSTDLQIDSDIRLDGLVEMIIRLGGLTAQAQPRWRFCCILLPKDSVLPLHQRSLVVRVQSKSGRHKLGETTVTPDASSSSLSIRALQSGHIVYLPKISRTDATIPFAKNDEGSVRSAIAIPIGGESGLALAVLYVASDYEAAFSENDQRVLRILCVMAEELLKTHSLRQQATQKLADIISTPTLVDSFFQDFLSENDFTHDVEQLLATIQSGRQERFIDNNPPNGETITDPGDASRWCLSFISIDIDKQSSLANIYGDRVTRKLAHKVGIRIKDQLRVAFKEYPQCRLYYIFADRFYILLQGIALDQARTTAEQLRLELAGSYKVDALRETADDPLRSGESMLELSHITVRLGVTSYSYEKLKEILDQYPSDDAVAEVRSIINSALGRTLDIGRDKDGNKIVAWNPDTRKFVVL